MVQLKDLRRSMAPYEAYPVQALLTRAAARAPNGVAVIDDEKSYTFAQLAEYSDRFAAALAMLGVTKGDPVGLLAPNCAEFVIAFYGIIKAGGAASTINSGYREREIAHQLNNSGSRILIVHESVLQMAHLARDAAPGVERLVVIKDSAADPASFWGLIESAPSAVPDVQIDPMQDLAALPYSSGTTGLSKGVMLTHYNLTSNLKQFVVRPGEAVKLTSDDVVLVHLPLFHIYGMQTLMNAAVLAGATQVMMGRFDMDLLLGLMSRHGVTQLYTVPPVALGLTLFPGVSGYDLSALKIGFLGAAPCSAELQLKMAEVVGAPVIQGYGMTELSPVTNVDFSEPHLATPGSVGPALADTEERVVDLETGERDLPPGEIGELLVRGPQVMKGYYRNDAATAETITDDGWLRTGDIVRANEAGSIWVLDRKKELIKYKGFQVPPAELEGLLLEHPAIADAAVIGKLDEESGEIPKAYVVRRTGAEVSGDDIMAFVAGKVATFKRVREVEFTDAIPKNASGKILRRTLIEKERGATPGPG